MDCTVAREAISASLDGEALGVDAAELSLHVAGCPACEAWREQAHILTRHVRVAAAEPPPRPGEQLLAAIRERGRGDAATRRTVQAARLALVAIAIGQIAAAVPALIFGSDHDAPLHVAHEAGSFELALAAGFLIVAWQPVRAHGMHLLVGTAALLLAVTACIDLAAGRTSVADEIPHLLVLAGWLLVYRIAAADVSTVARTATHA